MSIGGQTRGGLRNLIVRNCTFDGTESGIRMKAGRGQGGLVENCQYQHLTMKGVKVPIFITSYYPSIPNEVENDAAQPVNDQTPIWRNIRIEDVTATGGPEVGRIIGVAEMPVQDLVLNDVKITAKKGLKIVNAKGVKFVDSEFEVESGEKIVLFNADVTGIEK